MRRQRYFAATVGDNPPIFQLSRTSAAIVRVLVLYGPVTYTELRRRTRCPLQSLYVHVSRLKKAKLVSTEIERDVLRGTDTCYVRANHLLKPQPTKYVG